MHLPRPLRTWVLFPARPRRQAPRSLTQDAAKAEPVQKRLALPADSGTKPDPATAAKKKQAAGPKKPVASKYGKCDTCKKKPGLILVPLPGGKRHTALCVGCGDKTMFCTACKGVAKPLKKGEYDRCKACGWVNCDPECTGTGRGRAVDEFAP